MGSASFLAQNLTDLIGAKLRTFIDRYPHVLGLPADGKYIVFSNSDASKLACDRLFYFSQVEQLKHRGTARMDFGNAWDTLVEELYQWWKATDAPYPVSGLHRCVWCSGEGIPDGGDACEPCAGTGRSIVERAMSIFDNAVYGNEQTMSQEEWNEICETLLRVAQGYIHRYEGGPLQSMRVIDTQVSLARAIANPITGKPFRGQMLLEKQGDGWILARAGAVQRAGRGEVELKKVNWPWFQVGKLDLLVATRRDDVAWVIDAKASSQPTRYQNGMEVDPQLPGYCWLLEPHLEHFGLKGIGGFQYDVVHSKYQPDPKELVWKPPSMEKMKEMAAERGLTIKAKTSQEYQDALGITPGHGGFSVAQNAGVPSWRFRWALKEAGLDEAPYAEHIAFCEQHVDPNLYMRPWQKIGPDHWRRYSAEVFSKAVKMNLLRKAGAAATTGVQIDMSFPRTPVCMAPGGSCGYTQVCAQDGVEPRSAFKQLPGQSWSEGEGLELSTPHVQPPSLIPDIDW